MKNLILVLILPFFLSGCLYINNGVGLTTFQYDKCKEYYDADGIYHKDCPTSATAVASKNIKKISKEVAEVSKSISKKSKELFKSFGKKKKCPCKEKDAK